MMLFAFFGLWQTALGIGAAAISIPIIIHLINQKRYKIVEWAAMKFLINAQKQTRQRMRIEQILLLLCRMAILALICFAMSAVSPWAEEIWQGLGLAEWGPAPIARQHRIHHVIVLDASLSMNQKIDGGQTAFEKAKQLALRKIADCPSSDGYSVLVLKDAPFWLVGDASYNARKVSEAIRELRAGHGTASVPTALTLVSNKLKEASGRFPVQAVYFFTDMQHSTWQGHAGEDTAKAAPPAGEGPDKSDAKKKSDFLEISERASTVFVDCGPIEAPNNLAVTRVEFAYDNTAYLVTGSDPDEPDERAKGLTILATVKNFGKKVASGVRPELLIGKAKTVPGDNALHFRPDDKSDKSESIEPNGQHTFKFKHVFKEPGTYAVQVRIPDDALDPDNSRTIIVTVRRDFPVLLVNGKTSADRLKGASDYLRLALNPYPRGETAWWAPVKPTVKTPEQFSDLTDSELSGYDCIFWCDVPKFGPNDAHKLDLFVRRGGGLVVTMGDESAKSAALYNKHFHTGDHMLLPARFQTRKDNVIDVPPGHRFFMQTSAPNAFKDPPLAAFVDQGDQLVLRSANFRKFVHAIPDHRANVVLTFMEETTRQDAPKVESNTPRNAPAILEWNPPWARAQALAPPTLRPGQHVAVPPARYRGKVILFTSTVNTDWTSWPSNPSFGAMVQEWTRLAISGRLREQGQTVGGLLEGQIPGATETEITIHFPTELKLEPGKTRTQVVDEVNSFRWAESDFAGVYRAEFGPDPKHEIPFAVNVPFQSPSESDLSRTDKSELEGGYIGWKLQVVRDPLEASVAGGPVNEAAVESFQPVGPTVANIALLIVLGLMFVEIVMAWHFGHYTVSEGQLSDSPGGSTGTAFAGVMAALAAILCGIGALIVIHEKWTGDFLGFLPDILRTWFEYQMDIPPPPAGEGRFWSLEPRPFLFGLPGPENWYAALIFLTAVAVVFFIYKAEGPKVSLTFKLLLGVLRICLILATVYWLLPQYQQPFKRKSWPDLVILIDDSQSMGEPDSYSDGLVLERVNKLRLEIQKRMEKELPDRKRTLNAAIAKMEANANRSPDDNLQLDSLRNRLTYWKKQEVLLGKDQWRPSRLQLAQAILAQPEPHWLKTILKKEQKIHIFHLDIHGRATKLRDLNGDAGDIIERAHIERAEKALAALEPVGNQSRLGTAVRRVIEQYAGSSLSSVIMFTDGVTTRDERLSEVAKYAKQKNVALFFIGVGDESKARELKLQDLEVEDPIYLGDTAVFRVGVVANGFKGATVPVILKRIDKKTGKPEEIMREELRTEDGKKTPTTKLRHTPTEKGPHKYIIEIEPPKLLDGERPLPQADLRIERIIEVIDIEEIRVLYVEQQPRYEYRYLKFLMEREMPDDKKQKKKSIDLKVLLLEADAEFHLQDRHAIEHFPPTLEELNKYQVLIIGDCDPTHKKFAGAMKNIVAFASGLDDKGKPRGKPGGGVLFLAGPLNNPHRYRGTELEKIMPIEPTQGVPPGETPHEKPYRPKLTDAGSAHPIFRSFGAGNTHDKVFNSLAPIFWYPVKYKPAPGATTLAIKEGLKGEGEDVEKVSDHALVVQKFTGGAGRSMFFGFDETWRWRNASAPGKSDHEAKYNAFWIQTMRYLARGGSTRTELKLEKQVYQVGETIKVTVRFPDRTPGGKGAPKLDADTKVKVSVTHRPPNAKDNALERDDKEMVLAKKTESGVYEGTWPDTSREGTYRFRLTNPDVSDTQPDKQKPSAECEVVLPPGELENLRLDVADLRAAAGATTNGGYFPLDKAEDVLRVLPPGESVAITLPVPPLVWWNQWWVFILIVFLITSEWILRKVKHLL